MKAKSILQCAALLTGLLFLNVPLFATVESDIVGYSTIPLDNLGYTLLSLPFSDLQSGVSGYPVQSITGILSQFNAPALADSLLVMDPETKAYTTYYYKTVGWVKGSETTPTTDVIKPGTAVYLRKMRQAGSITIAGKVLVDETVSLPLTIGLNLVANPYPVEINIADITGTNLSRFNATALADSIMLLDPATKVYTTYYLKTAGWVKEGETEVTTDTIKANEGFVYKKMRTTGTLLFTNPL